MGSKRDGYREWERKREKEGEMGSPGQRKARVVLPRLWPLIKLRSPLL